MSQAGEFRAQVYQLVGQIPAGRLMTYGQIAALCGHPRAARIVGQIAHFGPADLPWQRVVKKTGDLADGYPGGRQGHQIMLEAEGIKVENFQVPLNDYLWWPD
jgi:methylated-DNA-protein-cysteine methyltransferase-like protein